MKKTAPLVSTIIVSYNTADLTCHAVQAVLNNYKHTHIDGEVIVVDNKSTDSSVTRLRKLFHDHIHLIQNKKNLGFAAGNNIGILKSRGQFVFLLNSDTVISNGDIKELLSTFQRYPDVNTAEQANTNEVDRLGIVSGRLVNLDGTLQKQGGALPSLWTIFLWWLWPLPGSASLSPNWSYHIEDPNFFEKEQKIGWVGGTAMMVRREVIDEIGLLDEGIFMYAEDVEYCLRARDHHWDIVYNPNTAIAHFGSASSSSGRATLGELIGLRYLANKHFPTWKASLIRKFLRLGCLLRLILFGIILGNEQKKKIYQEGFQKLSASWS